LSRSRIPFIDKQSEHASQSDPPPNPERGRQTANKRADSTAKMVRLSVDSFINELNKCFTDSQTAGKSVFVSQKRGEFTFIASDHSRAGDTQLTANVQ
jgi:hypothetical protein